jgi:dipeptidyl aminopeptidase/acylaminoacyl peptidase
LVVKSPPREAVVTPNTDCAGSLPLSPEELADRMIPEDPRISPDGSRVAFVAAPVGRAGERKAQAIWLAGPGQDARQVTAGIANDSDPRWSPDGASILFRSDRLAPTDEEQRLFVLPVSGGEARQLGELAGALSQPGWSPDGRLVSVLRQDPETDERKKLKEARDDAVVVEEQPRFSRLWLIDAENGRARCLTTGEREVRWYAWTPDGDAVVTVTTDAVEYDAIFSPSDLWYVPVAGGLPRRIATFRTTPSLPVVVSTKVKPVVAARADGHRDDPADSIWVVPLDGGEPRNILPELAGIVEEIVPLPGHPGKIAARIVERTHGRMYAVDVASGERSPLTLPGLAESGSVLHGVSFSADGRRVAAIWSDATTPEEVYLGAVGGDVSPVTSFGASFQGRLQRVEHVTWTAEDGVEVEGLLTYPAGYEPGRRYPLLVEVHGGPSWQWEDRVMLDWHDWAQMLASRGYAVLMPNPRGSTGYGHEFQRLLQDDVGGGESRDLITGAQAMVELGIADPDRLAIGGWSWGGYLTAWTITQTDIFRAAVMGAGLSNMISDHGQGDIPSANLLYYPGQPYHHLEAYWRSSPIRYVSAVKTPTLILHGDEDARVHPAQGMEFFRALKLLGVPVRFVRYPREKHGITERAHQIDLMNRIIDWLDRYLMRASAMTGEMPRSSA